MAQPTLPPWIQELQQRDPKFVESYLSQREYVLKDGAIPAKYKILMTMIVDALLSHPDGVATIASRAERTLHAGAGRGDRGRQELRVLCARAGRIVSPPASGYPLLRPPLRRGRRPFRSGGRAISPRAARRARDFRSPSPPRPLRPQADGRCLEALPAEPLARSRIRERDLP